MKSFFKGITFLIILFILLELISFIMIPNKANYFKYGVYKMSEYEVLTEKDDTIDVIFLGDSLIYSSISPMMIWNDYGFTSFDCAQPGQVIEDSYKYLDVALKAQHPKIVIMEADVIFRDINNDFNKGQRKEKLKNYLPLEKYHNNWKKLFPFSNYKIKWMNINKGYKYITKIEPVDKVKKINKNANTELLQIPESNLAYLDKIQELCEENEAKLILLSNPTQKTWNYSKHLTISQLAEEKNIEFIDLNVDVSLEIDWKTETKDGGRHINFMGAKKVSKYIGNYLEETNLLEDHRDDNKYNDWNLAFEKYIKSYSKYETNATT